QGKEVAKAPEGPLLALGNGSSCALRMDGELACWGKLEGAAPQGKFLALSLGFEDGCAVRDDDGQGALACFGQGPVTEKVPEGEFVDVAVGYAHGCALRRDGSIDC